MMRKTATTQTWVNAIILTTLMASSVCYCDPANNVNTLTADSFNPPPENSEDGSIRPYAKNRWFWQYKGEPVVLIGGSDDDNLFQWTGGQLTDHLDLLVSVGGNYVRNTMSDRDDGNVYAFRRLDNGLYDLDQWNDEYWDRCEFFFNETEKRGIIVQLTLWDQFDLGSRQWQEHPWNPENNVNMGADAWDSRGDFYATVNKDDQQGLHYQRKFIDKVLSVTLRYGNVLYNINNESSETAQWENYWAEYINQAGKAQDRDVYVTTMRVDPSSSVRQVMTRPEIYRFVEISQNNQDSRGGRGQGHWDNIIYFRSKIASHSSGPMPMNNEKVYGALDGVNYSAGTETEAINRFWRNIFAGCASSRFHRPAMPRAWGSGLNERVQRNLRAMGMLLEELDVFSCTPHSDLLSHRVPVATTMEAYATAHIGKQYAVYFPPGRYTVDLDPWVYADRMEVRWLDIDRLSWSEPEIVEVEWEGGQHDWGHRGRVRLTTPSNRPYVVLLEVVDPGEAWPLATAGGGDDRPEYKPISPGGRTAAVSGTYMNPILPGDWSDPGLIRVGHDYYSVRSTFGWQPGLPIVRSRDLLHWEYIGHGFVSHPKLLPGDTRNGIWGVEMGWNPNTKQFLIYAPTRDGEVFVYYANRPEGPYQVKSLGANLGIDPGFFADDDGRLYFMTNRALIYELDPDGLSIKRPVKQIDRTPYKLFEGPDIFKRGGYYYLLFSDGGTLPHEPSTITSLRARSLEGPWESDPGNPLMFSTDSGARFEAPAHGTLIDTPSGEWYIAYHAHEPAYYTLGRQFLLEPIEWTADGWWRPAGGKIPATSAKAPALAPAPLRLQQSDEFERPELGLQWFFTCAPDFSGKAWSLREKPGVLRIRTQKGDLHSLEALPGVFQQRVIDKAFAFETRVTFDARDGREAAGLHMYHDPLMNFWLATTVTNGKKRIAVGKHTLGVRQELWSVANPYGDRPVHLKIVVSDPETATFFHSPDGSDWRQLGESIYIGASGHHLRDGRRGDPDLGWVGRYKEPGVTPEEVNGLPENQSQKVRMGNTWTAATFGVFAVQDGAKTQKAADFDYIRVSGVSTSAGTRVKPRVIVTTDGEIDDQSSMVRFPRLWYPAMPAKGTPSTSSAR